ncbi:MAG: hypothetical protein LBN20_03460 [Endomicrobium sp.]|jgi:uncharacterized membrane protein affecting hemolysin expression|nr:hypothetical protein [Endomicrobium sp.]
MLTWLLEIAAEEGIRAWWRKRKIRIEKEKRRKRRNKIILCLVLVIVVLLCVIGSIHCSRTKADIGIEETNQIVIEQTAVK